VTLGQAALLAHVGEPVCTDLGDEPRRAALDVLATDCLDALVADVGPAHGARLEVDDIGPGVPAQQGEQVFEWFTRGARAGHRSDDTASGLGLALVDQHLSRHGGAVWGGGLSQRRRPVRRRAPGAAEMRSRLAAGVPDRVLS
jgi:hypothetical protein